MIKMTDRLLSQKGCRILSVYIHLTCQKLYKICHMTGGGIYIIYNIYPLSDHMFFVIGGVTRP